MDSKRIVSYILIFGIAIVFTLSFGPGSAGCQTGSLTPAGNAAAVVNGKEIPAQEFSRQYALQVQRMRGMGGALPESLLRQWVPQQVLESLVNTELLAQAAEKHGIVPSDEELARIIHGNPDFQADGVFDAKTYQRVLRDFYRKNHVEYEADLRRQLAAMKMQDFIESTANVSAEEVKSRYDREGNKAELTYVRFLPAFYADKVAAPTPKDLETFQKENEKLIAEDYERNRLTYHQSEQVKARHILIKVAPDAPAEKKTEAKEKVANLKKEIEGGKDFAELAKQFSEDVGSKNNGGDLGFNDRQAWVTPFADAAFSLKPGELSEPVETQFGYHLIKVEEKKPPQSRPLESVRGEIAQKLYKTEKAKTLAKNAAQKALADMKAGKKPLKDLFPPEKENQPAAMRFEQETRPEAVATEPFNAANESVPRLGMAPSLVQAVFARNAPGPLDEVFSVGDGFVIAAVTSRTLPSDAEFEQKKAQLTEEARRAKQNELTTSFLKALKSKGEVKTNEDVIATLIGSS